MRTLGQKWWMVKAEVVRLLKGERRYDTHGLIAMRCSSHHNQIDLPKLRQMILDVDREFPWRDPGYEGEVIPSIRYISEGEGVVNNWATPEKTLWFHIFPGCTNLRKGQVHAYEAYLKKLTQELARRVDSFDFKEVWSVVKVSGLLDYVPVEQQPNQKEVS